MQKPAFPIGKLKLIIERLAREVPRRDCTLRRLRMGTNRKKKALREKEAQPSRAGAWSPQAKGSVLPHLALNYSLQWVLPCAELLFHQLPSLTGIFHYKLLGLLWEFLLFRGLLLSSPTPCHLEITNFFIPLNPLLMFPSLTLIHFLHLL